MWAAVAVAVVAVAAVAVAAVALLRCRPSSWLGVHEQVASAEEDSRQNYNSLLGRFHQHFMRSFYLHRSLKRIKH